MRLIKLSEYRRQFFAPGSAPAMATLRRNIETIPGGTKMGGHYYVDLDEFNRRTNVRAGLAARQSELASSPLLEGLV